MLTTLQPPRSLSLSRFPFHFPSINPRSFSSSAATSLPRATADTLPQPSQILNLRHNLLSGHLTATQIADSYLSRLRQTEPQINSFLHVSDSILKQAQAIDDKILKGEDVGPLAGVLVAVKDNICTADMPSTGGSRILENYRAPYDATAVRRLKEMGAIVMGKTNLDEFGMGSSTEASAFQVFGIYIFGFFLL